jgi:O-acetylserine/cysteine efflux transporter
MKPLDFFLALLVMLIWGVNFVASKWAVTEIPPLLFTGVRFLCVGIILAPIFRVPDLKSRLPFLALFGLVLGVGHFGMTFIGLRGADASTAAIVVQLQVPMSAILAYLFFNDRMDWQSISGIVLAFIGVVLLAGEPHAAEWWAVCIIAFSALMWGTSNVILKKARPIDPFALNGWMAVMAAPQLLLLSGLFEHDHIAALTNASARAWGSFAFTTLCSSILAYSLWYRLISRYAMNQVVPLTLLGPVIGVVSGVVLMDDPVTLERVVGGGLTLAGVALIQLRVMHKAKQARLAARDGLA